MTDNKPHRIGDDAIHIALVSIQHRETAPHDFRVTKDVGIGQERDGEIAAPRKTVALQTVHKEIERTEPNRPHTHIAQLDMTRIGRSERAALGHRATNGNDLDIRNERTLPKPQIMKGQRGIRPPASVRNQAHLGRILHPVGRLLPQFGQ